MEYADLTVDDIKTVIMASKEAKKRDWKRFESLLPLSYSFLKKVEQSWTPPHILEFLRKLDEVRVADLAKKLFLKDPKISLLPSEEDIDICVSELIELTDISDPPPASLPAELVDATKQFIKDVIVSNIRKSNEKKPEENKFPVFWRKLNLTSQIAKENGVSLEEVYSFIELKDELTRRMYTRDEFMDSFYEASGMKNLEEGAAVQSEICDELGSITVILGNQDPLNTEGNKKFIQTKIKFFQDKYDDFLRSEVERIYK